jgi:hypothetical protein
MRRRVRYSYLAARCAGSPKLRAEGESFNEESVFSEHGSADLCEV